MKFSSPKKKKKKVDLRFFFFLGEDQKKSVKNNFYGWSKLKNVLKHRKWYYNQFWGGLSQWNDFNLVDLKSHNIHWW
jgi:hypothetical protein